MADYVNIIGGTLVLLGFALLFFVKGRDSGHVSILVVGFALVVLASLSFGLFTDLAGLSDLLVQKNRMSEASHGETKTVLGVWVFVFPAVIGAIGANLITAWFLAKK